MLFIFDDDGSIFLLFDVIFVERRVFLRGEDYRVGVGPLEVIHATRKIRERPRFAAERVDEP